ncbi:MAG TPA: alpha-amylase family glycosyl hydrolase [Longimicrobiaceae bacterium]|nr:alpha-amylase family glycosyl hydrolase [Longimicrobiaceae bacterium]
MRTEFFWWQQGIVYQVYPRSFMDSDGDGVGDLHGIVRRLDYLEWLGVDAVWVSPIYPSPMADFGYDVADYTAIHPLFGTMADFDRLLDEVHARGMRLILDLVPNHTSEAHPWFQESRSSRDNPKRDWYLWRDARPDGSEPNNWLSVFGGSAWQWDENTRQFYYHAFLKEQPDLNWRNPEVQQAMFQVMRFWLDRGVDGFRVDVMWHMIKDDQFRDNPPNSDYTPDLSPFRALIPAYSTDQAEVHDIVQMMRSVMDEYEQRVMIGEIYLPIDALVTYYGENGSGAHLPFNFQLIELPWDAREIAGAISAYEGSLPEGGWPNWVLGNHDKSRIASRVGEPQARVAAMLLLTLRGTPTMYYGDEIGMHDVAIPPDRVQDPQELNVPGLGLGRDPERTPMQWDGSPGAGFSTGRPWLPISDDYQEHNVERARHHDDSMLAFYRRLIELRRAEPALAVGSYAPLIAEGNVLAYIREADGSRFMVVLNLGHGPEVFVPEHREIVGEVVIGTRAGRGGERVGERVELKGDEGVVVRLEG